MTYKLSKKMLLLLLVILLIVSIFFSILIVGGLFVKPVYLKPWDKSYAKTNTDKRIQLIAVGELAANGHNMQPWKIVLDDINENVFYLYADETRFTKEVDPFARQMMITQGTFLEYVSIAGDEFGYPVTIDLFPEGDYDETNLVESMKQIPVAKVTLSKSESKDNPLFPFIYQPDTNRLVYQSQNISNDMITQLKSINDNPSLTVNVYTDEENKKKLGDYAMEGVKAEAATTRVMKESEVIFRSNESRKNRYGYGYSVEGQGTSGIKKYLLQGLVTIFPFMNQGKAAADLTIRISQDAINHTPAYFLILSSDNSRRNQIESGRLYSRLILKAHQEGIVMQPFSQPLEEYFEMQNIYNHIHKDYAMDKSTIQMFVRFGYPTGEVPLSIRQDVKKFIKSY